METVQASQPKAHRRITTARKPKKSQIPLALVVTLVTVGFGFYLNGINAKLPLYWLFGLAFGVILQRSRFCFTAAFRDPWITGSTSVTRAVLVALSLASIGFIAIKYALVIRGISPNMNMNGVEPVGLPLVIGAILFGIGMVISGGCASGTLMRIGEGFSMQLIVLLFFVIGSLWGAHDRGLFWDDLNQGMPSLFLPDIVGWFGTVILQSLLFVMLYLAALKWQEIKQAKRKN